MTPYVIGVCGKARSGKDTFAQMLTKELAGRTREGYAVFATVRSFATPLKSMLATLLSYTITEDEEQLTAMLYGDAKEIEIPSIGKSPRQMMQTLGTEWGRGLVDDNLWITTMTNTIAAAGGPLWKDADRTFVVIPDVRFDNEAAICDTIMEIQRDDAEAVTEHDSEAGINPYLIANTIDNNYDLGYLQDKAAEIAGYLIYRTGS